MVEITEKEFELFQKLKTRYEKQKKIMREYQKAHKEKMALTSKKWAENHREKLREYHRKRRAEQKEIKQQNVKKVLH